MSEKGFLCYRGRGREEEEEKQFYKLVLQLDLLTQYPQTSFPLPNKPIKFPDSSFGNTFNSVSKISHLWVNAESFKEHLALCSLWSQKEKPMGKENWGWRMRESYWSRVVAKSGRELVSTRHPLTCLASELGPLFWTVAKAFKVQNRIILRSNLYSQKVSSGMFSTLFQV